MLFVYLIFQSIFFLRIPTIELLHTEHRNIMPKSMYDGTVAHEEPFASCVPSWALLGKCDGVLRARLHPNENYPFAMRLTWRRGMEG